MANNRTCAIIYTVVVFFAGLVAGTLLMNITEHFWLHPGGHVITPRAWQATDRQKYVEQFKREVSLNDAQGRQLESILDETMRQYDDLHSFTHHIRDDGIARIRAILNDDQRKRFDELTRKRAPAEQPRARKLTP